VQSLESGTEVSSQYYPALFQAVVLSAMLRIKDLLMNEKKPLQRRQGVFHATRCGKESKQVVQAARGSAYENDFTVKRTKAQIEASLH
jgi:hypothetical protein